MVAVEAPSQQLSVKAAAKEANVSRRLIRHYIANGVLPAKQQVFPFVRDPVWVITRRDFDDWRMSRVGKPQRGKPHQKPERL